MAKTNKKNMFDFKEIKTYEDACKHLNINPDDLPDVSKLPDDFKSSTINYYKLCIIYKAINNGWEANWNNYDEYKYFPWLEVEASASAPSGFGFSGSHYYSTYAYTTVGSRLCTDTSEKALYIARTFQNEYKEFFLIQR